jgi:hypothetical protein
MNTTYINGFILIGICGTLVIKSENSQIVSKESVPSGSEIN